MLTLAVIIWAIDAASITALSAGIATVLGALAALGLAIVSMIKSLKEIKDEQKDVKKATADLKQLNSAEHNENANRIINMQSTLIDRLDIQDDKLYELTQAVGKLGDADETILVLIEDLERRTSNPHYSATVTKVPHRAIVGDSEHE